LGNWLREEAAAARERLKEVGRHTLVISLSVFVLPCVVFALFRPIGGAYVAKVIDDSLRWWYMGYVALVILIYIHRVTVGVLPVSQYEPLSRLPRTLTKLGAVLLVTFLLAVGVHLGVGLQTRSLFWAGILALGVSLIFFFGSLAILFPNASTERYVRGRRVLSLSEALSRAKDDPDGIPWGGAKTPLADATTHFAIVGAVGSGKTVTMRAIMKSLFPQLGGPRCQRALIYDTKGDTLPALAGMGLLGADRVHILNPFDARSCAWDMANDIRDRGSAVQLATILSPIDEHSTSPYFSHAARDLLIGVLCTFIRFAPGKWTLRDVVNAMLSTQNLKRVLSCSDEGQELLRKHRAVRDTWGNVEGSISTKIEPFRVIAALWSHCDRAISLESWFETDTILVLGSRSRYGEALESINRVLFRRLSEIATDELENTTARTWFFIDEAKYAGKLDGLSSLVDRGRSKGMCVVLGFQDVEGMRAVYSDKEADSLIGQCEHKAILRVASPGTAEWAVSVIGEYEAIDQRRSRSQQGLFGWTNTYSEQREKRQAYLPSQIMMFRAPDEEYGPEGIYLRRKFEAHISRLRWRDLDLPTDDPDTPSFLPRPQSEQELEPWTEADLIRLGLAGADAGSAHSAAGELEAEQDETAAGAPSSTTVETPSSAESPSSEDGGGTVVAAAPEPGPTGETAHPADAHTEPLGPRPRRPGLLDGVQHKPKR